MSETRPFLSICIPTYNRCQKIDRLLSSLASNRPEAYNVEIIVSDNASTDNTAEVIDKYKDKLPLTYYRNDENKGANANYFLLTDKYANGTFCWLLGDDDYLAPDAIKSIITALEEHPEVDYCTFNTQIVFLDQIAAITEKQRAPHDYVITSFAEAINAVCSPGNQLGTFISASVFRTEPFRSFDKTIFRNAFDDFRSTFPHSYIVATVFSRSEAILFPDSFVFTPLETESKKNDKGWSMSYIKVLNQHLPALYDYYIGIGIDDKIIERSKTILYYQNFYYIVTRFRRIRNQGIDFSYLYKAPFCKGFFRMFFRDAKRFLKNKVQK